MPQQQNVDGPAKPRRPKGGGTTWKLADGRHAHQQTVPPLPGETVQRPRITRYGKTAAEARRRVAEAIAERERQAKEAAQVTLAQFVTRWLDDVIRPTKRQRTVEAYEGTMRRYVLPPLGAKPLRTVTPGDLQQVYAALQRAGRPATAQYVHGVLHAALEYAVAWELLERNPAAARKLRPPHKPARRQALTSAEARRLINALRDHPDEALYLVTLCTGVREGELVGLRWASVDWQAGTIAIAEQRQRYIGQGSVVGPPKTHEHLVRPPAFVLDVLKRHQERQAFARQAAGSAWQEHGLVFPNELGGPQFGQTVLKRWKRLAAALGLGVTTLHELRHSAATLARAAGVPLEVVADMLGHASPTFTAGLYSHVLPEQREAAAEQFGAFLAPAPSPEPPAAVPEASESPG